MVNIIVMVLSPLGDYLCLRNRDSVNLEEACPVKRKKKNSFSFLLLKHYSTQH